ncbi:glutathione binding-like protein [Herbaspirillum sp. GCM10030257]|uniref:glutathione binding-like protein n=1 Tax=Herbaspirillum sp. GCM10030257 TaxID=3273393 RepID=UPI0036241B7E
MNPVLFYGVPSGCSIGSVIALEWIAQPYHLCRIEMLQHPWNEVYAKINPRMKTPALLLEDGASLTESLAILQNIGGRGIDAGLGFQQGTREFDRLAEMLSYLTTDLFAAFAPLWKLYDANETSGPTKEVLRKLGVESVNKEFSYLETLLSDRQWLLGGSKPTVADAYLFAIGRWAEYHKVCNLQESYPNVYRYLHRLGEDPAVRFALDIEQGKSVKDNGSFKGHVTFEELSARIAQ